MKNVTIIETSVNKNKSWKLISNKGEEFSFFSVFSNLLIKKYPKNTRFAYCRNVALFVDYLEEATLVYKDRQLTKSFLVEVIESFSEWLLYGDNSGSEIAVNINKSYQSKLYSKQTVDLIMASVRLFLKASERVRLEQESLGEKVDSKLFLEINTKEIVSSNVKQAMIKNSMIAGVVSNGPQLLNACILPIAKSQSYFNTERAFPFDKIIPLVDSFSNYRDKALYMLCAASGCRIHEALQILIEDIDLKTRTVFLIDPISRIDNKSYKSLTAEERDQLTWKGRQTNRTVLIQPFGDLFFEYLEQYIKQEYVQHNKHQFVFQHIRGKEKGKPFFLSASSTRNEAFKKAISKIGVENELNQGVHSLRHMYGTYLLNYFPKSDGSYGLPIAIVQKIMGHSTIGSTQKYARHDQDLISIELEYANSLLYNEKNNQLNLVEMKKRALTYQLLELEKQYNEI